jgi:hypothetical protein
VRFSIVNTLRETTLADLLASPTLPAESSIPTGPALPTVGVESLAAAHQSPTLTTGA